MNSLESLIRELPARVNGDPNLQRLGRYCSVEFLLECGPQSFYVTAARGHLAPVVVGPRRMRAWQFALRASPQAWQEFWAPVPAVGYNDIFAMSRYGHLRIEGDVGPLLENLRYLKEVLAMPRRMLQDAAA